MDPGEFRRVGHAIVDRLADYFATIESRPLFSNAEPAALAKLFDEPLPEDGVDAESVLREIEEKLLPHCTHVGHPGYFGLITPSPLPMGVLGDFIASALNQNVGAWTIGPGATALERQTVRWLTDLAGYGPAAGGNLTSGGMAANFLGLKLARDAVTGDRAQHAGVDGRFAVYASEERHVSVDKAVDAVGLGREAVRALPTDYAFRLRLEALEEAIGRDQAEGIRPLCIVGMAGTTNTGSVDDLVALRRIADREGMWLHVDAAYGGGMLLSRRKPGILEGLAAADSITIDPHKWFFAPLDAGAILVKDAAHLLRSFGMKPAYLTDEADADEARYQYYVHGFEQSRRFRSLKIWMSFKRYGTLQIGRWIDQNVLQAERLYSLAAADPEFRPATPPAMSAVCLRYEPKGIDEARLGPLHAQVARRIEAAGRFWISTTAMKGLTWFRINPVNFRTRLSHIDALFAELRAECRRVAAQR